MEGRYFCIVFVIISVWFFFYYIVFVVFVKGKGSRYRRELISIGSDSIRGRIYLLASLICFIYFFFVNSENWVLILIVGR